MADMTRDGLRELRARAMCRAMFPNVIGQMAWENTSPFKKSSYYLYADATMKADDAAGLAVVRAVPTDEMVAAGLRGAEIAGYLPEPVDDPAAHFVINAANRAGNILEEK